MFKVNRFWFIDLIILGMLIGIVVFTLKEIFHPGLYYAHDSIYHFVRLFHFNYELNAGQFPVRISSLLAYGYGYPLFTYVYPLPYLAGFFFNSLGLQLSDALKLTLFFCSLFSLIIWYLWLRLHFNRFSSFIGSLIFWFIPYRFLTIFVTFQLGTIVAMSFFPFVFIGIFLLTMKNFNPNCYRFGLIFFILGISGMLLSHLITLIIVFPIILIYLIIRLFELWKNSLSKIYFFKLIWIIFSSVVFVFGLTSFYWLPALIEKNWVKAGHQPIVDIDDHFPSIEQLFFPNWGYGYSVIGDEDGLSMQLGIAQWLIIVATFILLFIKAIIYKKKFQNNDKVLLILLITSFIYLFLMLEFSSLIWNISLLESLQHPWRLLAVFGILTSIMATLIAQTRFGKYLTIVFVLISIINVRNYLRPMSFDFMSDQTLLSKIEIIQSGDVSWEFLPIWANLSESLINSLSNSSISEIKSINEKSLKILKKENNEIVFAKIYHPAWLIYDNDKLIPAYKNSEGFLSANINSSDYSLKIKIGKTESSQLADVITISSFVLFVIFVFFSPSLIYPGKESK